MICDWSWKDTYLIQDEYNRYSGNLFRGVLPNYIIDNIEKWESVERLKELFNSNNHHLKHFCDVLDYDLFMSSEEQ